MAATLLDGPSVDVVTWAFVFIVGYITTRLLSQGKSVRNFTTDSDRENLFGARVGAEPLDFNGVPGLLESSRAAVVSYDSRLIDYLEKDTPITRDEIRGLMSNLMVFWASPTGHTRLDDWIEEIGHVVGKR